MLFALVVLMCATMVPLRATPVAAWSAPRTVYLDETGQTLDQLFLDLWRNAGGANAYGYPITPEIELPNGHVVQYLQYARFEYWPEGDAEGNTALIAKIGEELQPIAVPRTVATTGASTTGGLNPLEAMAEMKAWQKLPADPAPDDKSFVWVQETGHTIRGNFLAFWYDSGSDGYLGNPLTEEYTKNGVTYQVFERGQLQYSEDDGVSMVPIGKILADKYKLDQGPVAQGDIPSYSESLFTPPGPAYGYVDPNQELWVDINLSAQYMTVYSGDTPVLDTYVSTGRPGFDTPTGTFYVSVMMKSDDMEGVLGGEYYNVPQVPDVLYFTGQGHAIHGAYWHSNFGAVMSHGCVNLPLEVADWLYANAFIGMRIVIHY
jgi:lipoprotein-anchoring transpeptidase ErfK/SrfK